MDTIINKEKISRYLSIIKENIEHDNINGYYDINRKMEDIVAKLLELTYEFELINTNDIYPNYPAIDLADEKRRIAIQVTSDNSIDKINKTFEKFVNSKENLKDKYDRLIFFMIKGKLSRYDMRKIKSKGIKFDKNIDIIDYKDIMKKIESFTNEKLYPIANFLENQYVSKLVKKISEVKRINCEDVTKKYVERKVIQIGKNDYFNMENRKSLYTIIANNNKIVLLSDAGEGKTEEAKRIVNYINKKEKSICAFYKRLNKYTDKSIEEMIPKEYEGLPPQNLLLVFDGLDEIENRNRSIFVKKIEEYNEENKNIKVVVTCRKNFYDPHNDSFEGTLKGYNEYLLCKISNDDINEVLIKEQINQDDFWNEIKRKQLQYMVYNPFYLNYILRKYIDNKSLPVKERFLDEMINECFLEDRNKYKNSMDLKDSKEHIENLLEIIGLTLEFLGRNYLSDKEYRDLIRKKENRELLNYNSLWVKNEDGNWSFIHNNFGEYFAAKRISEYPIEIIKKAICFEKIPNKINPTWVNTLTFLVNQYKNSELTEWIISVMPEFLSYIEKDYIDIEKRKEIFWKIYKQYKEKKVWMPYDIYKTNNLVCDEIDIEFLLNEIKENSHYISVGNSLHILDNVDGLYGKEYQIKETLINICMNNKYTSYNKSDAIHILADFKLGSLDDLLKIIEHNKLNENSRLRESYFYFCNTLKIVDESIDIFIERFEVEHRGMRTTWSEEDDDVYFVDEHMEFENGFSLIKEEKTLKRILYFFEKIEFTNREDNEKIIKNLCDSIFNIYFEKNSIIESLLKIYIKCEEHYNYDNMNIILEKVKKEGVLLEFFKEYMKLGKNKAYRVYEQIIDDECMEYYYYEYEKGKYSDNITEKIMMFCNSDLKFYDKLKKLYEKRTKKILKNKEHIDYDKVRKDSIQYFFDKLFKKEDFLGLIKEFSNEMPNKEIRIKELQEIRHYNRMEIDSKYQYTSNFLVWQFKDEEIITTNTFEKWDWDYFILSEVYKIIHEDKNEIELSEEQQKIIQDICNKEILKVDFRNAIKYNKDKTWTTNWLCIYLWFYRYKFNFKYPNDILLDMLEFEFVIDGTNIGIAYIEEQVNKIDINNRIIENIKSRNIHMDVFKNHIQYCISNKISNCIDAVGKHLMNKNLYDDERIMATKYMMEFMEIKDFMNKYFYSLDIDFQKKIVGNIIKRDRTILYEWLVKKLRYSKKIEDKMFFAQQLIIIGKEEGIKYYCKWVKKTNSVYVDRNTYNDINSEISNIKSVQMLDYLLSLLEITFLDDFKDKSFDGIYSNVKKAIINIGTNDETCFILTKEKLNNLFERNKNYIHIGEINYIIDEMEHIYCMNSQHVMNIPEIKSNIKKWIHKLSTMM